MVEEYNIATTHCKSLKMLNNLIACNPKIVGVGNDQMLLFSHIEWNATIVNFYIIGCYYLHCCTYYYIHKLLSTIIS